MKKLALIIVFMFLPLSSYAQGWGYGKHEKHYEYRENNYSFWKDVQRCQQDLHWRIDLGIENGQLTRKELRQLKREQRHLSKQIRHLRHHRYLSQADERSILDHLDHLSEKIRYLKHNNNYVYNGHHNHAFMQHYGNGLSAGVFFEF
jgi:hypothetical protein